MIGKTVQNRHGPAAVTGDCPAISTVSKEMGRSPVQADPGVRRPAERHMSDPSSEAKMAVDVWAIYQAPDHPAYTQCTFLL